MKRTDRLRLEQLSVQAFGNKSRYKKLLDKGGYVNVLGKTKKGEQISIQQKEYIDLDSLEQLMQEIIEERAEAILKAQKELGEKEIGEAKITPSDKE